MRLITRQMKEDRERELIKLGLLSPEYSLSEQTKGRKRPDKVSTWRTEYELDRDRILHSDCRKLLADKPQVHIFPSILC